MKKATRQTNYSDRDFDRNKVIELDKIKTTNVNILLNRVKLDKKKQIKKKVILTVFIFLVSSLIALAVF